MNQRAVLRDLAGEKPESDENGLTGGEDTSRERPRTQGYVVECNGTHAVISADVDESGRGKENYWAVGQLISIVQGSNRVVGQTYKVESLSEAWKPKRSGQIRIHIELVGEIQEFEDGKTSFSTGIADYPRIGSPAHRIRSADLEAIYKNNSHAAVPIGNLTQDTKIQAKIDLDKLLSRHFALVGSTGVGKSSAVSLLLRKIIANRNDLRVIILDPHDEFTAAFADEAIVKDASSLQLPFWMFRFAEFTEVVFRGQAGAEQEVELLRDLIAEAKEHHAHNGAAPARLAKTRNANSGFTADSPVPYRIADLMKVIDERLGLLESKRDKPLLNALKARIVSISRDPRFDFMFGQAATGGDRMAAIIAELFRVPANDKPICIIEMSSLPSEVVNSVVSVLCRVAFDLAMNSQGAVQTLVMCEEAHRYVPADPNAGFWPTRQSIARIAKEGRKYGVYLGVITQRPSELDPTILSQCNTVFAMRLANQADQKIIGGALTIGAQSTIGFLASIANREAIAFGEALHTPMRMTFETVPQSQLPGSHIRDVQEKVRNGMAVEIGAVVRRMRGIGEKTEDDSADDIALLGEPLGIDLEDIAEPAAHAASKQSSGPAVFNDDLAMGSDLPSLPPLRPYDPNRDLPGASVRPREMAQMHASEPASYERTSMAGAGSLISAFRSRS